LKKALLLGGTHDHIRLARLLKDHNYRVILIDYLENPPAGTEADEHIRESTLDTGRVLEIALKLKPEIVITACIDQALVTMAFVAEKLGLPCHLSHQTALELTSKALMKQKFINAGIPTAAYMVVSGDLQIDTSRLTWPLVVKPSDANSSKGVIRVDKPESLDSAIRMALTFSRRHQAVVEEFRKGTELSADLIIRNGKSTLLMVTRNIKSSLCPDNFTIKSNLFPGTNNPDILQSIEQIADKIAAEFGLVNTPLLVQLLEDGGNLSVIEFSARIGGGSKHHFIRAITGFDILKYYLEILLGKDPPAPVLNYRNNHGCIEYIYTSDGVIGGFHGFDSLLHEEIISEHFYYKNTGMKVTSHCSSNDRAAGYLITATTEKALSEKRRIAGMRLKILDNTGKDMMIHEER